MLMLVMLRKKCLLAALLLPLLPSIHAKDLGFRPPETGSATMLLADPPSTSSRTNSSSETQWRVFLGLALLAASYIFRVEVVRFTLHLVRRAIPNMTIWIKEFEKNLLRPLSWVVFLLLVWFSVYVMDLSGLLGIKSDTISSFVALVLGFPLVWVVICFCNYVTWGIIRIQGWNRAASKYEDDYSRVMIVTEGIGVIKILLIAAVLSSFILDQLGNLADLDTAQISTVAVLMIELVIIFGSHTWLKNVMGGLIALIDEQIKSGLHVRFQTHEGVVERLFLQCFSLRQYDKGLAYIPNGMLLEHTFEVETKAFDRRCTIPIRFDRRTISSRSIRTLIQEIDDFFSKYYNEKQQTHNKRNKALGLIKKPKQGWGLFDIYESTKLATVKAQETGSNQFWISMEAPYVVHVVYTTHERHMKPRMAEKTEIILQITEIVNRLKLRLDHAHATTNVLSPRAGAGASTVKKSGHTKPPTSAPLPVHRTVSDGNVLRRRRQTTSSAV